MTNKKKEQVIEQCFHCGNKGLMDVVATHNKRFGGTYVTDCGEIENDLMEDFIWQVLSCPVCCFVTLIQKYTCEGNYNPYINTQIYDIEILYPENKINLNNVPKNIASSFESALKIQNINSDLTLISLRKTLELICNDKNAKGRDLKSKINYLIKDNIFPEEFNDAYWIVRHLGNKAAHTDETGIHTRDVKAIINLLYVIINYLYVTPHNMKYLKEKLEEEQ